jgi:hypothetical protein
VRRTRSRGAARPPASRGTVRGEKRSSNNHNEWSEFTPRNGTRATKLSAEVDGVTEDGNQRPKDGVRPVGDCARSRSVLNRIGALRRRDETRNGAAESQRTTRRSSGDGYTPVSASVKCSRRIGEVRQQAAPGSVRGPVVSVPPASPFGYVAAKSTRARMRRSSADNGAAGASGAATNADGGRSGRNGGSVQPTCGFAEPPGFEGSWKRGLRGRPAGARHFFSTS